MWLWVYGLIGAFIYANAELILNLWSEERTKRSVERSVATFIAALISGGAFAQVLSDPSRSLLSKFVGVNDVDTAFIIGLSSNYLWPIVLRAMGQRAQKMVGGEGKGGTPSKDSVR